MSIHAIHIEGLGLFRHVDCEGSFLGGILVVGLVALLGDSLELLTTYDEVDLRCDLLSFEAPSGHLLSLVARRCSSSHHNACLMAWKASGLDSGMPAGAPLCTRTIWNRKQWAAVHALGSAGGCEDQCRGGGSRFRRRMLTPVLLKFTFLR